MRGTRRALAAVGILPPAVAGGAAGLPEEGAAGRLLGTGAGCLVAKALADERAGNVGVPPARETGCPDPEEVVMQNSNTRKNCMSKGANMRVKYTYDETNMVLK